MGERIHPEDWLLKPGSSPDPPELTVFDQVMKRTSRLEYHPKTRIGPVTVGANAPQWSLHADKRASKVIPRITIGDGQVSPWAPFCVDPFRVPLFRDPKGCRTSLQGGTCSSAQHTPPQGNKMRCMRELCRECTRHMGRAGLQSKTGPAGPSLRSQRCSHGCSTSLTQSPSAGAWGWSGPSD